MVNEKKNKSNLEPKKFIEQVAEMFKTFEALSAAKQELVLAVFEADYFNLELEKDGWDPEVEKLLLDIRDVFRSLQKPLRKEN